MAVMHFSAQHTGIMSAVGVLTTSITTEASSWFFFFVACGWHRPAPPALPPRTAPWSPQPPESPPSALAAAKQSPEHADPDRGHPHDSAQVPPANLQPAEHPHGYRLRGIHETDRRSEGKARSPASPGRSERDAAEQPGQPAEPRGHRTDARRRRAAQEESRVLHHPAAVESQSRDEAPGGERERTCYRAACLPGELPRPKTGSSLPDTPLIGGGAWRDSANGPKSGARPKIHHAPLWSLTTKCKSTWAPLLNDAVM